MPAFFRVENRYTGSTDVLGGAVQWSTLCLNYKVCLMNGGGDPDTVSVGEYLTCYAGAIDGEVPSLKGSEHRSAHPDGVVRVSPKVWRMALRVYRVS